MESTSIYKDIAMRTNGDIYVGVVGPVRSGKSTFIKNFMETLVIPNIEDEAHKTRAVDEMPQSAAGRTIMTTEPKYIPEEAVRIRLDDAAELNVRMIDCVGYIVPSSIGYFEDEAPRMVVTPWFPEEIPFNMAAEIGTQKVINDHSTIGLVVTTDGSITDIKRSEYEEAEERVVSELKAINKPFVVLLNSVFPKSQECVSLAENLSEKYGVPVMPVSCTDLKEDDITEILSKILYTFPIKEMEIEMPRWIGSLSKDHWLRSQVYSCIQSSAMNADIISDIRSAAAVMEECEYVNGTTVKSINLGSGSAVIEIQIDNALFYKVLGEITGLDIEDDSELMPYMISLAGMKKEFEKFKGALEEVEATGYGIVMPTMDELSLEEPEIVKQGGKYGIRLRASAPSIHNERIKQMCKFSA